MFSILNILKCHVTEEQQGVVYLLVPEAAQSVVEHVCVFTRVTNKLSLEECHIEAGGVVVDKLKEEHLDCQPVLILQMGLWDFCGTKEGS